MLRCTYNIKGVLKIEDGREWMGFVWLRTGINGRLLYTRLNFRFPYNVGILLTMSGLLNLFSFCSAGNFGKI
jgi:hypothetical protein